MAACRVCGARGGIEHTTVVDAYVNQDIRYAMCPICGSLQHEQGLSPIDFAEVDIYASVSEYAHICSRRVSKLFRSGPLVRHMKPGLLFNVEVNDGHIAAEWMNRGWDVDGSSLSRISARRADDIGVDVVVGNVAMVIDKIGKSEYDAMTVDVGHCRFASPLGEMRRVVSRIRPGGAVMITGPNPESPELISGQHSHLNVFNQTIPSIAAFSDFAKQTGLTLVKRTDEGADVTLLYVKVLD